MSDTAQLEGHVESIDVHTLVPDLSVFGLRADDLKSSDLRASIVLESTSTYFHGSFKYFVESKLRGRLPLSVVDRRRYTVRFSVSDASDATRDQVDQFASWIARCAGLVENSYATEIWQVDYRPLSSQIAIKTLLDLISQAQKPDPHGS